MLIVSMMEGAEQSLLVRANESPTDSRTFLEIVRSLTLLR